MTQGMHTISRLLVFLFSAVFSCAFYIALNTTISFFLKATTKFVICFLFKCGLLAVKIKNNDDSKIYKIHIRAALSHSAVQA